MTTGHVFMAISLDGFVARKDDEIDWLTKQETGSEDHGYADFMASVDGIIMGSGSFRSVLTFGEWPYKKPVVVMSRSMSQSEVPAELDGMVQVSAVAPAELMKSLRQDGWSRAYVDGGKIVQSFMKHGLIDDLNLTIIPILIGDGKRLFGPIERDIDLELLGSTAFKSGLVQNRYRVVGYAKASRSPRATSKEVRRT